MFDLGETWTMIDRTSCYTLLKYFSDSCTTIYLSHRFPVGRGHEIKNVSSFSLITLHLRESHRYCTGHWYIGRMSIVTKSTSIHRTYQWRVSEKEDWTSCSSSKWFEDETSSETFSFPRRVQDDAPTFWTPPLSC